MRFYMPTRLYCEKDCVARHAAELASLGRHALVVTGASSSRKNHSLYDVLGALESENVTYTVFDRTEENPSAETVIAAAELGAEKGADFVIGVGGGSPIDAAKAAALMIKDPGSGIGRMFSDAPAEALPVAAVPTTCGTGSEVTGVSVITRHDLGTKMSLKHRIFPRLALVDGKYLLGAPRSLIVNTAIDTLAHLCESGVNTLADAASSMYVFMGLSRWQECRPYIDGSAELDGDGALSLMETAALGGIAIAQTGTTLPHALSYMLTYEAGVPHGQAVGAFLGNYMRYADTIDSAQLLAAAGFASAEELSAFIQTYAPVSVSRDLLERSAESVLAKPEKLKLCPYPVDGKLMKKLIEI
ncbi:MAG: iron-containing alcohol dehydrogenase [Ruminococcus sp.]|nr:iron-containing alcohol dehydrogenase [Ruminococcus sp.]